MEILKKLHLKFEQMIDPIKSQPALVTTDLLPPIPGGGRQGPEIARGREEVPAAILWLEKVKPVNDKKKFKDTISTDQSPPTPAPPSNAPAPTIPHPATHLTPAPSCNDTSKAPHQPPPSPAPDPTRPPPTIPNSPDPTAILTPAPPRHQSTPPTMQELLCNSSNVDSVADSHLAQEEDGGAVVLGERGQIRTE